MVQDDKISKEIAELKGTDFSFINSAKARTLSGWHPLLKDFIRDE